MKIKDTAIGQKVTKLGADIEAQRSGAPQTAALPAEANAQSLDALERAPGRVDGGGRPLAEELKQKLDEVRGMLGPKAVDELLRELPAAALAALKELTPELPVAPGKSPYLAFREKQAALLEMEKTVHGLRSVMTQAYTGFRHGDDSGWLDHGRAAQALQQGTTEAFIQGHRYGREYGLRDLSQGEQNMRKLNDELRARWPDVPKEYLLRLPDGSGGTASVADLPGRYGDSRGAYPKTDVASLRAQMPAYVTLQKEITILKAHLEKTAFPSEQEIMALKAQLLDENVSVRDLYREATAVIGELEGFAHTSEVRRETLHSSGTSSSRSAGVTAAPVDASGLSVVTGYSASASSARSSGSSEALLVSARDYTVVQSPPLESVDWKTIDTYNHKSTVEVQMMVERLVAVRRIYEAMRVREPESDFVAALKGWMEDSTFSIKAFPSWSSRGGDAPTTQVTLKLGELRANILGAAEKGYYPKERLGVIKDELALGPARPKSGLVGLRALSDL